MQPFFDKFWIITRNKSNFSIYYKYLNKECKEVSTKKTFLGLYSISLYSLKLFVTTIIFGTIKKGIVVLPKSNCKFSYFKKSILSFKGISNKTCYRL